jgi:hypothetical protein
VIPSPFKWQHYAPHIILLCALVLPLPNVPGVFVVGDVRKGSVKRVASGVSEGSIAISFVHQYLSKVV